MSIKTADFEEFRINTGKSPAGRAIWTFLIDGDFELTLEGAWSWATKEAAKIAVSCGGHSVKLTRKA